MASGLSSLLLRLAGSADDRPAEGVVVGSSVMFFVTAGWAVIGYLFGAMGLVGGTLVGLLVFEARIVRAGIVTFVVLLVATTVVERMGIFPYAPLFAQAPLEASSVSTAELMLVGGLNFAILLVVVFAFLAGTQLLSDRELIRRATALIRRYVASQVAERTVCMALEMQRRMGELEAKWYAGGIQTPFRIRIGINTGVASVGDYGSEGRTTYSAIGNQTNLAARIQDHCDPGGVLISHTTWGLVKDEIRCKEHGEVEFKGLHYPVRVYEVIEDTARESGATPSERLG